MGVEHVSTFSYYVACEQSKPRENAWPWHSRLLLRGALA